MNDIYSCHGPAEGNFTNADLTKTDPKEWNNTRVFGSCFYQESSYDVDALSATPKDPRKNVFPLEMTGVTFDRCNLDNCIIPPGNTVLLNCTHIRCRVQNDLDDWELDTDNKPTRPLNHKQRERTSVSVDAKDIPATRMTAEQKREFNQVLYTRPVVEVVQ